MTTLKDSIEDLPPEFANLSPAFAAMVAQLTIPQQYSKFVQVTVESLNSKCKSRVKYIDK